MKIGIGIDTGGTYTDAIALDYETGSVLAKGKALTTKESLTIGIGEALDLLPVEYLHQAKIIALSTTLATNACVEDKGGRARLIMLGTTRRVFDFIDAEKEYGLKRDDTLCLDTRELRARAEKAEIPIFSEPADDLDDSDLWGGEGEGEGDGILSDSRAEQSGYLPSETPNGQSSGLPGEGSSKITGEVLSVNSSMTSDKSSSETHSKATDQSADGVLEIREKDLADLLDSAEDWIRDSDILSVVELDAPINGSGIERTARSILESRYQVPVVLGSDLVNGLNIMERGATALLNARLRPIIEEFVGNVATALTMRGIAVPAMIVRSDGSLMIDSLSRHRPVETILSGPAASVLGGRGLSASENCVIVDMGGTTTDISMIRNGVPAMAERGIRIGGWHTQVSGVFMDTFALGGDSAVRMRNGRLELSRRRALPICAAAERFPSIRNDLEKLLATGKPHTHPMHEFLYLVKAPVDQILNDPTDTAAKEQPQRSGQHGHSKYNRQELALCEALRNGPLMIGNLEKIAGIDLYNLKIDRLEAEGVIMRCGLTPTDIMHIRGDFTRYSRETSLIAARYFMKCLSSYSADEAGIMRFTDDIYDLVKRKLFSNLARILLSDKLPELFRKKDNDQVRFLIRQTWNQWLKKRKDPEYKPFFGLNFTSGATLVGIGAPTHVFLPEVAQAFGTTCIIPEHAEVANAVGAAIADITTHTKIDISPNYTEAGITNYTVRDIEGKQVHDTLEQAIEAARTAAIQEAMMEARRRGALGELKVETQVNPLTAFTNSGAEIDLGTSVHATVTARILD